MIDRYEMLTGDRISKQLLEYHSAGFCGVNGFLMWGLAYDTTLDQDYIAYMHYSVATTRWAIKDIAEHMGLTLTEQEDPMFRTLGFSRAGKQTGEASGRERVWQYVSMSVVAGYFKNKKHKMNVARK